MEGRGGEEEEGGLTASNSPSEVGGNKCSGVKATSFSCRT